MSIRSNVDGRRLNERVTFQRRTLTRNGSGENIESWPDLKNCRAAVDGAKAKSIEPNLSDGIKSQADYTVWVRSDIIIRFRITVADRLSWRGKLFNIKDIPDQQLRGRLIALICNTGLNAG
ncbi:MAG: phage head closure protein [Betaproteobacteria bacterium]|nr:phage head closure protein [Betaproteobacteria bacterium]